MTSGRTFRSFPKVPLRQHIGKSSHQRLTAGVPTPQPINPNHGRVQIDLTPQQAVGPQRIDRNSVPHKVTAPSSLLRRRKMIRPTDGDLVLEELARLGGGGATWMLRLAASVQDAVGSGGADDEQLRPHVIGQMEMAVALEARHQLGKERNEALGTDLWVKMRRVTLGEAMVSSK
jgi:hypothetical protein